MPLDQAVIDHRVVGGVAGDDGAPPQIDVIVVAARRDMIAASLKPLRDAGLEPVGVDLSAFGMIRALGETAADLRPRARREAPTARRALSSTATSATSPTWPSPRAAPASSPASPRSASRISPPASRRHRADPRARPHVARIHVGLERPLEQIEGDPDAARQGPRRHWRRGAGTLLDELRLSLDFYGAQEAAVPVERIVLCGPGSAIPGLAERMEPTLGLPIAIGRPAALSGLDDGHRRPPHPPLRPRPGAASDAPRQPDPQRGPPRRASGRCAAARSPTSSSAPWPLRRDRRQPRWSSPATRSPTARPKSPGSKRKRPRSKRKPRQLAPTPSSTTVREQRVATVTSLADSRFDWERVMRELALVLPAQRLADQPDRHRQPRRGSAEGAASVALRSSDRRPGAGDGRLRAAARTPSPASSRR